MIAFTALMIIQPCDIGQALCPSRPTFPAIRKPKVNRFGGKGSCFQNLAKLPPKNSSNLQHFKANHTKWWSVPASSRCQQPRGDRSRKENHHYTEGNADNMETLSILRLPKHMLLYVYIYIYTNKKQINIMILIKKIIVIIVIMI